MKTGLLNEAHPLPQVVEPESAAERDFEQLLEWTTAEHEWIEAQLLGPGAVLLRGFDVESPQQFERFCRQLGAPLRSYAGGDTPRKPVSGNVYTSTEYPSHQAIPLHNEMSYAAEWPARLFFFCVQPAAEQGQTPIADSRRVFEAIDPDVRQRFAEREILYVRNLHGGFGLGRSWQDTFETDDRETIESRCREASIEFRWDDDNLHLSQRRPAITTHPRSGEQVWFNQADLWHVSNLGPKRQEAMLRMMKEQELPQHAFHGDGSPIDTADLEAVRAVYRDQMVVYPWEKGDLLMLDNVLAAHGRKPFKGERKILAAMA